MDTTVSFWATFVASCSIAIWSKHKYFGRHTLQEVTQSRVSERIGDCYPLLKPVPILLILIRLCAVVDRTSNELSLPGFKSSVMLALLLGAAGDICLTQSNRICLVIGIVSFLVGHLFYTAVFAARWCSVFSGLPTALIAAASALLWGCVTLRHVTRSAHSRPQLKTLVQSRFVLSLLFLSIIMFYFGCLFFMFLATISFCYCHQLSPIAAVGGFLFVISDLMLAALVCGISSGSLHQTFSYSVLPCYYFGQAFLAQGAEEMMSKY